MDYTDTVVVATCVHKSHEFAVHLCKAMGVFAYVVVAYVDKAKNLVAFGGWAGDVPAGITSRAPHVAYGKMGELVLLGGGLNGNLIMTPIEGNELSFHWMGAVAQKGWIVAVSKWAQEHDRLLALLTLYDLVHHRLKLHHVGVRFPDTETYRIANARYGKGINRDASDHKGTYFQMLGGYGREHQWFPDGPHDEARHWDFLTDEPRDLLIFLANAYGKSPVFFDEVGEHDPVGVVWITGSDGTKLGVMARKNR